MKLNLKTKALSSICYFLLYGAKHFTPFNDRSDCDNNFWYLNAVTKEVFDCIRLLEETDQKDPDVILFQSEFLRELNDGDYDPEQIEEWIIDFLDLKDQQEINDSKIIQWIRQWKQEQETV